jgi:glycosyltransferase involved in cell wall biosynthesis
VKVLVTTEQRFHLTDGRVVTAGALGYDFWTRYLDVFDEVGVLARVHRGPTTPGAHQEVTGPGVRVLGVPAYVGPGGYVLSWPRLRRAVTVAAEPGSAVIVRAPSPLGTLLLGRLRHHHRRAFGLEVVGDPLEVFTPGAVRHPLRAVFRWWFAGRLRRQCRQAAAVCYLTRESLPTRYPPRGGSDGQFVTVCASVDLPPSSLAERARDPATFRPPFRVVTVASLEQPYKGVDLLIRGVGLCRERGLAVSLTVVGDGVERPRLETMTRALSLGEHVRFVGQVASPRDVVPHLETAHLFVLASRTEGLPKALVEAMARALPCIGSETGGIPELLSTDDRIPVGNVSALAEKLATVLAAPETLAAMSLRNLDRARGYTSDVLRPRWRAFHEAVQAATLAAQPGADG